MHIPFEANARVKEVLGNVGRTEDLAFSPDNRRLAIAAYSQNKILMLDIDISATADGSSIFISDCCEILCPDLKNPHGIAWIDQQNIIVGNRFGQTIVLRVPPSSPGSNQLELEALQVLPYIFTDSPNSNDCLAISPLGRDLYEILVCSNSGNYVSSHILDGADNFSEIGSAILLENKLQIPDGIALSPDKRWIAVSSHNDHSVYIYENIKSLGPASEPCAILTGITYPHGIVFTEEAHFVFVAAAGAPFIYGYHSPSGEWRGEYQPFTTLKSVADETFARGHINEQEGGTKGIDLAHDHGVLAMTCQEQPLAFAQLSAPMHALEHKNLSNAVKKIAPHNPDDFLQRNLRCMKMDQERLIRLHQESMQRLLSSTSWQITQPMRRLKRSLVQCAAAIKRWYA